MMNPTDLAAGEGVAVRVDAGRSVRVVCASGAQVVDTWFFSAADPAEFASMEHCRVWWLKLWPEPGDVFWTNRHNRLAEMTADTSPGDHDTLLAACNPDRYRVLGAASGHANCQDTLHRELARLNLSTPVTPQPLNLFMNIPAPGGNLLQRKETAARPGDAVTFSAVADMVAVFSACPMDAPESPISGAAGPQGGVRIELPD